MLLIMGCFVHQHLGSSAPARSVFPHRPGIFLALSPVITDATVPPLVSSTPETLTFPAVYASAFFACSACRRRYVRRRRSSRHRGPPAPPGWLAADAGVAATGGCDR